MTANDSRALGVYLHVPFCASRCGYCDFNTYTASELGRDSATISRDTWHEFAAMELQQARTSEQLRGDVRQVSTVFFGGGTPTQVPATHLAHTLSVIGDIFGLAPGAEITTEANPDSVDAKSLETLRQAGFTRISFGHQSSSSAVLKVLERSHEPETTWQAVRAAKQAGFEHINVDLIYATPGESDDDLRRTLDDVIAANVDHVSAYSLIVEPGTRLASQVRRGQVASPDDDIAADRYRIVDESLTAAGFQWYEVSNWAKPDAMCQHNILYWHNHDWWGVGPGAHSHVDGLRWWNHKHPATWARALACGESPIADSDTVDAAGRAVETIMLGLRLREGLPTSLIAPELADRVRQFAADGLLDSAALRVGRAVLTDAGRLLADALIRDLTP